MDVSFGIEENISFKLDSVNEEKSSFKIAQDDEITIQTNDAYHKQGLKQAQIGFYSSLFGAALGFVFIIVAAVFAMFLKKDQAILVGISGVIIDAISAIFFKISNDASNARTAYFDKLRDDTIRRDSLMLCNTIENTNVKDNLKVKLALYFAGINEEKICSNTISICGIKDTKAAI